MKFVYITGPYVGSSYHQTEAKITYNREHAEEPTNVRIGLNAGESIEEEGVYFDTAVTLAARIPDGGGRGDPGLQRCTGACCREGFRVRRPQEEEAAGIR